MRSAMLCLAIPPRVAKRLLIQGAVPREDLHLTLAYFPDVQYQEFQQLGKLATKIARATPPISARISGCARFTAGERDAFVATVDSADLCDFRDYLALKASSIARVSRDHGFTAHITLAYLEQTAPSPIRRLETFDANFPRLEVWSGSLHRFSAPFGVS